MHTAQYTQRRRILAGPDPRQNSRMCCGGRTLSPHTRSFISGWDLVLLKAKLFRVVVIHSWYSLYLLKFKMSYIRLEQERVLILTVGWGCGVRGPLRPPLAMPLPNSWLSCGLNRFGRIISAASRNGWLVAATATLRNGWLVAATDASRNGWLTAAVTGTMVGPSWPLAVPWWQTWPLGGGSGPGGIGRVAENEVLRRSGGLMSS